MHLLARFEWRVGVIDLGDRNAIHLLLGGEVEGIEVAILRCRP